MKSFSFLVLSTILINTATIAQENWEVINNGTADNLTDVCFIDNQIGWIIGYSGTLLRTTDAGESWNLIIIPYQNLKAIQFVNQNTGWIVGDEGLIIKSTDGGNTWYEQEGGQNYYLEDLHFFNDQVGIICGGTMGLGRLLRTTNGGNHWDEIALPIYSPRLLSIFFLNNNLGWTTGANEILYRTIDAGISWDSIAYLAGGIMNSHFGLYFADSLNGNICGAEYHGTGNNNSSIYKSSDGGFSWTRVAGVGYGIFNSLAYNTTSNSIYSVGNGGWPGTVGRIYKSIDGGDNWEEVSNPSPETLNEITFTEHKGWIVGRNGTILTTLISASVEEIDIVSEYKLSQNYPNPFNPSTTIKYQISEISFVAIKIYDVLGNEIATLVNEEKPTGSYEVEFDGTNLPSSIYFYRLQAGSPSAGSGQSFVETKKMVLLK